MADTVPDGCSIKFVEFFFNYCCEKHHGGVLVIEDNLLCDALLAISTDFVGMDKSPTFWQSLYASFHEQKHFMPSTCI